MKIARLMLKFFLSEVLWQVTNRQHNDTAPFPGAKQFIRSVSQAEAQKVLAVCFEMENAKEIEAYFVETFAL